MSRRFLTPVNLLHVATDPVVATEGDIYYNTTSDKIRVYIGDSWSDVGGSSIEVSDTAPESPQIGSAWYDNTTGSFYIYDGTYWVEVNGVVSLTQEEVQDYVAPLFTHSNHVNITASYDDENNEVILTGSSPGSDSFKTISVSGQDSVVADSSTDTLSLVAGTNVSIITNATTDSITINADSKSTSSVYLVRNNTGSTILKGTLVSASGAEPSGRIDVEPFAAVGGINSELTVMGMATTNISNGVNGEVISFGTLTGIDTRGSTASAIAVGDETWAEGDILFAHPTVAGKLTNVRPQHDLAVAFITVRHASTGQIAVRIVPGNNHLEWMHDVLISSVAEDQVLRYDDATGLWKNTHPNIITAKNATESTISAFTPVYINTQEFDQDNITFAPADAATSMYLAKLPADAITITSVASNSFAKLVTMGVVSGVDLTGYSLGELLYVGVGGGLTSTRPTGTNAIQPFARVLSTDNGTIYVYGNTFASSINSLPNLETDKIWLGTSGRPVETTLSTSVVAEGSNLYFTDERAQDATSSMIVDGSHNGISVEYVDASGIFNFTNTGVTSLYGTLNEIEVSALNGDITIGLPSSITISDITFSGDSSNQSTAFLGISSYDTADITEGTNLYFTDERARAALSADLGGTAGGIRIIAPTSASDATLSNDSATHQVVVGPSGAGTNIKGTMSILASSSISDPGNLGVAGYIDAEGSITGSSIIKDGGLSTEFLKADGSVDSNTYLTSYTETDPVYTASSWYTTTNNASNWDTSYGWGDHASVGYLTSESDTLETVTDRGATSSNAITISNATESSSPTTGALVVTGGVGIGEDLYVDNDVYIGGNINITGTITGDLTSIDVTNLVITDPLIYLAEGNPDDSVDIGIFAALNHGGPSYKHTGLIRDASDSGKWKLVSNLDDPVSNVIDFTSANFDTLKVGALEVSDAGTTRTNLGLAIGTNVQAYDSTLAAVAGGTYAGDDSIITLGTVTTGAWNGTTIEYAYGGTGLTTLGTAGQVLKVNSAEDALEWGTVSGGGGSSAAAVTSDPPSSPELNQVWQDLDTGRIYVWDGDFWIEVQQNGSLGLLRYLGASATAPTTSIDGSDLQVGEVYFDTTFNVMKVYDGTGWEDAFTAGSLSVSRWIYTATGGETTLSGDDDNDVALAYTAGIEEVYLNGVKLIRTSDYLATDGEEITLEPLVAGSVVEVISYSGFTVADTYTKAEVDDLIQKQGVRWTEVAGAGTSITTLVGTDDYLNTLAYTPGTEQVFVNGILIVRGLDYTATNGTSIVLNTALTPGDVVEVIGNSAFSIANTYTKAEIDAKDADIMVFALSDEFSNLTTGLARVTFRAPFGMTLTQIPRASLSTASSSGLPTVDINVNGTSILGANKLSIDINEKTSVTAVTPTTLSTTGISDDSEITFDIDVAGTGAKGLKVVLYYKRA